jgi:hypothetical protein
MPGTLTSAGGASGETSTRRTPFCESASTEGRLREGRAAQQRLDVKAIGDLD